MRTNKDIRKCVRNWAMKVGISHAIAHLIYSGISVRAAEKLCLGIYPSQPKSIRPKLEIAIKKGAEALGGAAAS